MATTSIPLQVPKTLRVSDEQFVEFVKANPELRLERTASGELIAMPPTGSESGAYNSELNVDIGLWNRQRCLGKVFDSSSGFRLPNGAIRSPDLAWVSQSRWNRLTPAQQKGFAPLCPDFVVELVSPSDDLDSLKAKMQEYMDNGCQLGWLINPQLRTVDIYRSQSPKETVDFTEPLSGEAVLPGLVLDLSTIFVD
jgi:Uma2 family endonuclease